MDDSNRQSSKQPPWHQEQDLEQVTFGTWLRRQREARGIELREIADHTKIGIRYLDALERDRFDVLPAPVFTKGFLSQYGRYIGLDPDQVVNTYLNALQESDASKNEEPSRRRAERQRSAVSVIVVVAVLALLALAGYLWFWRGRSSETRQEARPPIAAPTVLPVSPPAVEMEPLPEETPVLAPLVVTLDFVDDSWLETVVDGERQLSEQIGKGESRRILAEADVVLSLGNPLGVRVEVNGLPYELPAAAPGATVLEVSLDLATVARLAGEGGP